MYERGHPGWHWSISYSTSIDFAVWVLEQSGLAVPPFDQHNMHDTPPANAGLTPDDWHEWLRRLVSEDRAYRAAPLPHQSWRRFITQPMSYYPIGDEQLQTTLVRLWEQFTLITNSRRTFERKLVALLRQEPEPGSLYRDMNLAHGDLPPVGVTLVGYPAAIRYLVPPAGLILAPGVGLYDFATLRTTLLQALADLQVQ